VARIGHDEITERYIRMFNYEDEQLTIKEMAQRLGVSPWAVYRGIKKLIDKGYIEEHHKGSRRRGRPTKVFRLTQRGIRFLRVLGGKVEIEEVISVLRPTFKQLRSGDIVHSIAGLERFLNDDRRSIIARRMGLSLWTVLLVKYAGSELSFNHINDVIVDIHRDVWSNSSVPDILKARAFVGIVWIALPYITGIRRLLIVPEKILLSEEELVFYISVHWDGIQRFIDEWII